MARCAVDASVVVKWFLEEEFAEEARKLRNDHLAEAITVEAPAVLPFEVLNAARFSGALDRSELVRIADALEQASIPLYDLGGSLAAKALEVALETDLTVYDASYVALAQILDAPLYTADEEMLRATRGLAPVKHVRTYRGPSTE